MAFLDFLKRRELSPATSQSPTFSTPETARLYFEREAANDQANRTPIEKLPEAEKAKALEAARPAAQLMERATSHLNMDHGNPNSPGDGKLALVHNQGAPAKSQEALSPTDAGKGHTHIQGRNRARGMER